MRRTFLTLAILAATASPAAAHDSLSFDDHGFADDAFIGGG